MKFLRNPFIYGLPAGTDCRNLAISFKYFLKYGDLGQLFQKKFFTYVEIVSSRLEKWKIPPLKNNGDVNK